MSLNGNLQDFDLTEVLQFLSRGKHTGLLTLTGRCESDHGPALPMAAKIYFHAGKVSFATSGFRDRLGHRLIDNGLLSREAIRSVLDKQKQGSSHQPLGFLLVEANVLCSETIGRELRAQVLQVIRTVIDWPSGTFRFEKQVAPVVDRLGADPAITIEHLLLAIHCQRDEEVLAAAAACLPSPEVVVSAM